MANVKGISKVAQNSVQDPDTWSLAQFNLRHIQIVFAPAKSDFVPLLINSSIASAGHLGDYIVPPATTSAFQVHVFRQTDGVQLVAAGKQLQVDIEIPSDQREPTKALSYATSRFKRLGRQILPVVGKDADWLGVICTYMRKLSASKPIEEILLEFLDSNGFPLKEGQQPIAFQRVVGFRENGWNCNRRLEGYQTHQGVFAPEVAQMDVGLFPIIESGIQFITDVNDRSIGKRASVGKKMQAAIDVNLKHASLWLDTELEALK